MLVVAIETSGSIGSVAVIRDDSTIDERLFEKGLRHGKALVPSIDAMLREHGIQPRAVDLFAVSQGPGSYTGTRVGVTCAKTFAYGLGKPVVGVSTLDAVAFNAPESAAKVYAVIDARRRRLYFCGYTRSGEHLVSDGHRQVIAVEHAVEIMEPGACVVGDACKLYRSVFEEHGMIVAPEDAWLPKASGVARLGLQRFREHGPDDPFTLVPVYMNRPEADVLYEERMKKTRT